MYADAEVTADERRYLDELRQALALAPEVAERMETGAAANRYRVAAVEAMADGIVTPAEAAELKRMLERFGLTDKRAGAIVGDAARDAYLDLFREVIRDGRITAEELAQLQQFRTAMGITRNDANEIVREEALRLYRQWFYNIIQDGEVNPEEEKGLSWLRMEFGLTTLDTESYDDQLAEVKRLAGYRRGELPTKRSSKLLQGGEICHWESSCCFQWQTATMTKNVDGELILTSDQLAFVSATKSFTLSPSKILDITRYSDCLVIQSSTSRGTGTYFILKPYHLEAILEGLVRKHKFHLTTSSSSAQTRHIPDSIRREVWQRDGGQCVRCKASDYLEYDHIIPHSRGGANTVANVQILCRRCNNLKSNRI